MRNQFLRTYGIIFAVVSLFAIIFFALIIFEPSMRADLPLVALTEAQQQNLYQSAIGSILSQSEIFSSWSIALIAVAWFVLINREKKTQASTSLFIAICGISVVSLFFGQMLHQVVVSDIRRATDPLFDPSIERFMVFQYWSTMLSGLATATAITWERLSG